MKLISMLCLFLVLLQGSAIAIQDNSIAKCKKILDEKERLECFDSIMLEKNKPANDKETKQSVDWNVSTSKSKIDDSNNVYLSLNSEEPVEYKYNNEYPVLYVICAENTTKMFVYWKKYLGLDQMKVKYRLDEEKARTKYWKISTSHEDVGLFVGNKSIPFVRSMFGKKKLVFEVTPYSEGPVVASFNIAGLEGAIKPLRKSCGW